MSKRQTRSDGLLQSTKNGGKPNYWTGNSDPRPIEAPQELIFNGKFQYSKFECPPNLEESKIRAEGFYNHAYAPIGNDNALYTPMPKDMFQQMEFDRILVPSETRTISMLDYMKKYQPQKTYMAVSYFQALANGTLPESYGAPKKKLKNEQGNLGQLPEM